MSITSNTTIKRKIGTMVYHLPYTGKERLALARRVCGAWKQRSEKELKAELKKIRAGWERHYPPARS